MFEDKNTSMYSIEEKYIGRKICQIIHFWRQIYLKTNISADIFEEVPINEPEAEVFCCAPPPEACCA